MVHVIVAYDEIASKGGSYFQESFDYIAGKLNALSAVTVRPLPNARCTKQSIKSEIESLEKFIFVGISHGHETLLKANSIYVESSDLALFEGSFFYTAACLTGRILGPALIAHGCVAYIGYTVDVDVWLSHSSTFADCENYALCEFITSDKTVRTVFDEAVTRYNTEINRLLNGNFLDVIAASFLRSNRNGLLIIGNERSTVHDFDC